MKLKNFKVLTFDCYGTLIDWETGILAGLRPLAAKASKPFSPDELLGIFATHESAQEVETPTMPYSQLLATVYRRMAAQWRIDIRSEEANIFGASVPDWPEFPDSVAALRYLKRHYKLVILSNVDRISFRSSNARLRAQFDAIYTAQDVGAYKPNPRNFEFMLERLATDFGIGPREILHTAQSLFHDHAPANRMGLASAWIDRRHDDKGWGATMPPPGTPRYDFRFEGMAQMVRAHQEELREKPRQGRKQGKK